MNKKGIHHISKITVAPLKDLIWYKFKSDLYKQLQILKPALVKGTIALYNKQSEAENNCASTSEEDINNDNVIPV